MLMNVAQRPVVIAFRMKLVEAAGSVGRMGRIAFHGGMENADIEHSLRGSGISGDEVLGGLLIPEAVAVQRHLQMIDEKGLGSAGVERKDIVGPLELLGHLAFGVMVAEEKINWNT